MFCGLLFAVWVQPLCIPVVSLLARRVLCGFLDFGFGFALLRCFAGRLSFRWHESLCCLWLVFVVWSGFSLVCSL